MRVSENQGPKKGPQHIVVVIIGTPNKGPLILGNSHIGIGVFPKIRGPFLVVLIISKSLVILGAMTGLFMFGNSHIVYGM